MSNAIDILIVVGPANGKMVCMDRRWLTTYIEYPVSGVQGLVKYTRRKWPNPETGKIYHIATRDEDNVTDMEVITEIVMRNFQPAWDVPQP